MKRWIDRIRDLKFKYKIMLGYMICCLGSICILGGYTVNKSRELLREQALTDLNSALQQAGIMLDDQLELYDNILGNLSINSTITAAAEHEYTSYYDMYDIFVNNVIPPMASAMIFNSDIEQLTLYSDSNIERHTPWVLPSREIPASLRAGKINQWVLDEDGRIVKIRKMSSFSKENYIYIRVNKDRLNRNFLNLSDQGYGIVTTDMYGNEACRNTYNGLEEDIPLESLQQSGQNVFRWNGRKYICIVNVLEKSNWKIYIYQPEDIFVRATMRLIPGIVGILLICLASAFLLSLFSARFIVVRIEKLAENIRQIKNGDNTIWVRSDSKDEIGYLTGQFTAMMQSINSLIDDVYKEQLMRKEYQIKMLQAQINPHFLYNTLSAIRWKTLMAGNEEASEIVNQLSVFYRTAVNKGNEFTSVESELRNVRAYIKIQENLQNDKFHTVYEIEEELYEYRMLNMLLQPIVENAILHGLANKRDKEGILIIRAVDRDENILFEIQDNGVGIEEGKLKELLYSDSKGYGVKNVHERIRLLYGNQYGLSIESEKGQGTIVQVVVPKESDALYVEN